MDMGGMSFNPSAVFNDARSSFLDAYGFYRDKESDSQRQHAEDIAHSNRNEDYRRQKEFAQMGIQWRVEDAKAAGVHPVWSLSGGGAAFAPTPVSVGSGVQNSFQSTHGQGFGRSVAATQTPYERSMQRLQMELMLAQVKKTDAEAMAITRTALGGNRVGDSQVGPGMPATGDGLILGSDFSFTAPAGRISSDRGDLSQSAADPSPFMERFTVKDADGNPVTIRLPSSGKGTPVESLESISESLPILWAVLKDNLREDPDLLYRLRHLIPFGEDISALSGALDRVGQGYLNRRKAQAAAAEMMRRQRQDNERRYRSLGGR